MPLYLFIYIISPYTCDFLDEGSYRIASAIGCYLAYTVALQYARTHVKSPHKVQVHNAHQVYYRHKCAMFQNCKSTTIGSGGAIPLEVNTSGQMINPLEESKRLHIVQDDVQAWH